MSYTYEYPHPAVTVDVVVFTVEDGVLQVVLVRRDRWPYAGQWALPGGFVEIDESLKRAAWRELREETGVTAGHIEQLGAFDRPDRDPRERVITVAYIALEPVDQLRIRPGSDAREARRFAIDALPALAFDHDKILRSAVDRLRGRIRIIDIARHLMPLAFTLPEFQRACETVQGVTLDKRNFRKRIKSLDILEPTGETIRSGPHRPAMLYRIKPGDTNAG